MNARAKFLGDVAMLAGIMLISVPWLVVVGLLEEWEKVRHWIHWRRRTGWQLSDSRPFRMPNGRHYVNETWFHVETGESREVIVR